MKKLVFLISVFSSQIVCFSQTTNRGELSILPNTILSTESSLVNAPTGNIVNDGTLFIYRDYENNGNVGFSNGSSGLTVFQSGVVQTISGAQESRLMNVVFNNSTQISAFELENDILVHGSVDFQDGIINNDDFNGRFTFNTQATHTGTSNASFVDGEVRKFGEVPFRFPVGDNGFYRFSSISSPNLATDLFSSQYYLSNSSLIYAHDQLNSSSIKYIDKEEYWKVERVNGSADVVVALSWDLLTTDQFVLDNISNAHILKWNDATNGWDDLGGVVDLANQTISTPVSINEFGIFAIGIVYSGSELEKCVMVYNALSINNDGLNEFMQIDCLENFPNNTVEIFNRWGAKVFETRNYNTSNNVFRGISEGVATINADAKLPTGTYFYIINVIDDTDPNNIIEVKKSGYLYLETK